MSEPRLNERYLAGEWAAKRLVKHINNSIYSSVENAIAVKQEVIKNFETTFGYSREDLSDGNYAFELGFLDYLLEHHGNTN